MEKSTIIVAIVIVIFLAVFIWFLLSYKGTNKSNTYKSNLNAGDSCIYDKLNNKFGGVSLLSGEVKFQKTIIPRDMFIYLLPNSIIKISPEQDIIADNTELNIGSSSVINQLSAIRDDCNLPPGKLSLITIGKDVGEWKYSIKTNEYPAIVFFEEGLIIQTTNLKSEDDPLIKRLVGTLKNTFSRQVTVDRGDRQFILNPGESAYILTSGDVRYENKHTVLLSQPLIIEGYGPFDLEKIIGQRTQPFEQLDIIQPQGSRIQIVKK